MDDLAKRLSIFSFVIIGIIFIVGVLQKRDWLEMFTIGGQSNVGAQDPLLTRILDSVTRSCCNSGRFAHRDDCNFSSRCFADVETKSHYKEVAERRSIGKC